jgi:preprotein translocase subunit YajC
MEPVKKDNFNNEDREMKKIKGKNDAKANTKVSTKENKKGKPKGVEIMKEAVLDELLSSLKKKDLVKEDVHPTYNVGAEVYTHNGKGKIKEIIGSTFTIEMEDGSLVDVQINTVDHHTEKAKETEKEGALSKSELDAAWTQRDKENPKVFGGMLTDPEHFKKPLDPEAIKKYIAMYKHDKKKMKALKELVVLKTQKGTSIPGGVFGSDGSATSYINTLDPTAKSQIKKSTIA